MKRHEYNILPPGLYRLHWRAGGSTLAAVGIRRNGKRWMAPINWVEPPEASKCWRWWTGVSRAESLFNESINS